MAYLTNSFPLLSFAVNNSLPFQQLNLLLEAFILHLGLLEQVLQFSNLGLRAWLALILQPRYLQLVVGANVSLRLHMCLSIPQGFERGPRCVQGRC